MIAFRILKNPHFTLKKMSHLGKRSHGSDEKKSVKRRRFDSSKNKKQMFLLSSKSEMKCVDNTSTGATLAFTSAAPKALLNGSVPGNAIQNRLGRRIRMKSLRIQGMINQYQAGTTPIDDFIHIYVVYDSQPNGATFATADLIQSCDAAGTTGTGTFSFINMSNSKRFKVIRHESMKIETTGAAANQPAQESTDFKKVQSIDWWIPLKDLDTQYNTGTAGTIADIQTGSLYLMLFGASAAADSQYALTYNTRLRFVDL